MHRRRAAVAVALVVAAAAAVGVAVEAVVAYARRRFDEWMDARDGTTRAG